MGGVLVFGLFYAIFVYNPGCQIDFPKQHRDLIELEISASVKGYVERNAHLPESEEELIASASASYRQFEDLFSGIRLNYHPVSARRAVVWANGYDEDNDNGMKAFNPTMENYPIVLWDETEAGPVIASVTPLVGEGSMTPEDIDGDLVVQITLKEGAFDPEDFLEFEWFETGPVDWGNLE